MPHGHPGQPQCRKTKTHLSHTQTQTIKVSIGTFLFSLHSWTKPTFLDPSRREHRASRRCFWATRVLHQLQTRKMATPDSLSSLQAQLTLKWMGKDPEIVTVLEPETICWKKPIIRSHVWFSETSTILKKGVEPKCKWRTNTHTNQWANPTKMSTEIPRAEKWSPRGRGGGQEKGYMGSPLWWQTEAKLSALQWILKSNYNPVHRKQFVKKKKWT